MKDARGHGSNGRGGGAAAPTSMPLAKAENQYMAAHQGGIQFGVPSVEGANLSASLMERGGADKEQHSDWSEHELHDYSAV